MNPSRMTRLSQAPLFCTRCSIVKSSYILTIPSSSLGNAYPLERRRPSESPLKPESQPHVSATCTRLPMVKDTYV
ncbi:hypothetical protein HYQ45_013993 [Verticillium longisporum]|uniref:Uncharacterized protein n=1 Tax=Verticillium longisporum TaxID=100787 RepID=A0A8I2ZBE4_VERLO|nr:hypothetical protein HYQ45_013993 [Verticillium longisporum]